MRGYEQCTFVRDAQGCPLLAFRVGSAPRNVRCARQVPTRVLTREIALEGDLEAVAEDPGVVARRAVSGA